MSVVFELVCRFICKLCTYSKSTYNFPFSISLGSRGLGRWGGGGGSGRMNNYCTYITAASSISVPAIVFRRLPRGFRERERRFKVSPPLSSPPSASLGAVPLAVASPTWTCNKDLRAADIRSKRLPDVSTRISSAGYLWGGIKVNFELIYWCRCTVKLKLRLMNSSNSRSF